jgi:hypothetical protein
VLSSLLNALPDSLHMTELALILSTEASGTVANLACATITAPPYSSVDAEFWYHKHIWPEQTGTTEDLQEDTKVLFSAVARRAEDVTICTVTGSGTTLLDGTLNLGANAAIVFDSSCSNVSLNKLTVNGVLFHTPLVLVSHGCGPSKQYLDSACRGSARVLREGVLCDSEPVCTEPVHGHVPGRSPCKPRPNQPVPQRE